MQDLVIAPLRSFGPPIGRLIEGSVLKGDEEIRALGFGRVLDEAERLGPQAG